MNSLETELSISDVAVINAEALAPLDEVTQSAHNTLRDFATSQDFLTGVTTAFGSLVAAERVEVLRQQWADGDFEALPPIAILSAAELNDAKGAFSSDTNTIYLSREFVVEHAANPQAIANVLLEEIGHSVDAQINQQDATGDEGEIFAALAQGRTPNTQQLQALRAQDDAIAITVNGATVAAEAAAEDNLGLLSTSLGPLLDKISQSIATQSLNNLPLLGNVPLGQFANQFIDPIKASVLQELNQVEDETVDSVRQALFDALGQGGLNLLQDSDDAGDGISIADIEIIQDANSIEFEFKVGQNFNPDISFAENLGLPGLDLSLNGDVNTDLNFGLDLSFGVDNTTGADAFFVNTSAANEFQAGLNTTLVDENNQPLELAGTLGFLELQATDNGSNLTGNFTADFAGGGGQVRFSDIASIGVADPRLTAATDVKLALNTGVSQNLGIDNGLIPSIAANFNLLGLQFDSTTSDTPPPSIAFNNVTLDLGTFFNKFVDPVLGGIQDITAPLRPITDILDTPLPFPLSNQKLVDLAPVFGGFVTPGTAGLIDGVGNVIELINSIPLGLGDDAKIQPGDFPISGPIVQSNDLAALADDPLQQLKDLGAGAFAENLEENPTFQFPILTTPERVIDLLLGEPDVELFNLNLPPLGLGFEYEQKIPIFGPIVAVIGGAVGAEVNLDFGFDSFGLAQFQANGFTDVSDITEGFFVTSLRPEDTPPPLPLPKNPLFSTIGLGAEVIAGVGLDVGAISTDIVAGIRATLALDLAEPKTRISDLANLGCILEPSGAMDVFVAARLKIGFGPFSFRKRIDLLRETLLDFRAGCAGSTIDHNQAVNDGNGNLTLSVGAAASNLTEINGTTDDDVMVVDHTGGTLGNETVDVAAYGATFSYPNVATILADAGIGNDVIQLNDGVLAPATLIGGAGEDELRGGNNSDVINGGIGEDAIFGGKGNDSNLSGDAGDDFLDGGAGNDTLNGGEGFDAVSFAGATNGVQINLSLGANSFVFDGDGGQDTFNSIEQIDGSTHNDSIVADIDASSNVVDGLEGNDSLVGGEGDDFLIGSAGADTINGGAGTNDSTSYIASKAPVIINLATNQNMNGDAQGDQLFSVEDIQGSGESDSLTGNANANFLDGSLGNDTIIGAAGADVLDGSLGIDLASYETSATAVSVSLKTGQGTAGDAAGDKLEFVKNEAGIPTALNSLENLEGSDFSDSLLQGDDGNNDIKGLAGNDNLQGEESNDTLSGGAGADALNGGGSIDLANYRDSSGAVTVNLQTGTGLGADAAGDTFAQLNGVSTVENLLGSDFADNLAGDTGVNDIDPGLSNSGIDLVNGGFNLLLDDRLLIDYSRNDSGTGITGGFNLNTFDSGFISRNIKGTNTILDAVSYFNIERLRLIGTTQNDQIFSGSKDDQLFMGAGNDTINGGQGSNTIRAEDGNDVVIDQDNINRNFDGTPGNSLIDLDGGRGIDTLSIDLTGKSVENTFFVVNVVLESTNPNQERNQKFTSGGGTLAISNFEIFKEIETDFGFDRLVQLGKVDNKFSTGNANDAVNAGLGFDTVDGGSDSLDGGSGGDFLTIDYSVGDTGSGMIMTPADDESGNPGEAFRFINTLPDEDQPDRIEFFDFERFQITGTTKGDLILTGRANDTVNGGAGNDTVNDNIGIDSLDGGAGFDILSDNLSDKSYDVFLSNFDIGEINLEGPDGTIIKNFEAFQNIRTGSGNDTLVQLGKLDNNFNTGEGNDFVNAGLGFDTVDGDAFLEREASNDLLVINYSSQDTGSGMEMFFGGEGTSSQGSAFRFISTLPGEDQFLDRIEFDNFERFQVIGTSKDDSIVTAGFASGNDVVTGGAGNDSISTRGGNDTLNGGVGTDFLDGGEGGDRLSGNENDDTISGNSGNDNLLGGSGNDILRGTNSFSTDIDTLTGGIGADEFVFFGLGDFEPLYYDTAGNNDFALITDFNPTEGDTISLPTCGNGGSYSLGTPAPGLPSGIAIFGRNEVSGANDLIAIVQGVPTLNLNDSAFNFFGAACSTIG